MIWGALIIPVILLIIATYKFHHQIVWWEYILAMLIPVLLIMASKYIAVRSMTDDTEVWSNYATDARYYEAWDEYVHQTCTLCSGSGKSQTCSTYDCSYVDYHSEYWELHDNGGARHRVSMGRYNMAVSLWGGKKKFVDMRRDYHHNDGDMYTTKLPINSGIRENITISTDHTYENKVQASTNVFNFEKVDPEDVSHYGLYEYKGTSKYKHTYFYGDGNKRANDLLSFTNAKYGYRKQLNISVLVYQHAPSIVAQYQKSYWKGGNKNEFLILISKKGKNIDWVEVVSWTPNFDLIQKVKSDILAMGSYDAIKIAEYIEQNVPSKFVRREWKEFAYIDIQPSTNAIMWTYILTFLASGGLLWYFIANEFEN